jgi:osmoprotectant transport system substrate-binding protein
MRSVLIVLMLAALAVAGCGGDDSGGGGGGSQSSSDQLGRGKPSITIGDKSNIGSSEITDKALTSGQIDMYPDYVGTILSVVATRSAASATPTRPRTCTGCRAWRA